MSWAAFEQGLTEVAEALAGLRKVIISCHIKPDGDALGCCLALDLALRQKSIDSVVYMSGTDPFPPEFAHILDGRQVLQGDLPADYRERTLVALDCGNAERIGNEELTANAAAIIDIDHHVDNSRFGGINLVIPEASSTAEILYHVLGRMKADITPGIAEALYTGILVDSGRFQYSSTTPETFRVAADLISRGVDHTEVFRRVYENMPLSKAKLLCRMLSRMQILCRGRLAVGILDDEDFREADATNGLTEGLVDNLRAIEGVVVAALIYARVGEAAGREPHYRVSLRSSGDKVNVQAIAKLKNGGGHTQAAGLSSDEAPHELLQFLEENVGKALGGC